MPKNFGSRCTFGDERSSSGNLGASFGNNACLNFPSNHTSFRYWRRCSRGNPAAYCVCKFSQILVRSICKQFRPAFRMEFAKGMKTALCSFANKTYFSGTSSLYVKFVRYSTLPQVEMKTNKSGKNPLNIVQRQQKSCSHEQTTILRLLAPAPA